ncbi:MAG: chemotaxis protein CheB [bacterium]|nr:chemotaxis protein CheB [bacterium]
MRAIVIGVSAGGLNALRHILPKLPEGFPLPVMIVQHLSPDSDGYMVHCLDQCCQLTVKEVDEKESIKPSTIYIAPPNYHVLVEEDFTFSLSVEARVNYARPAIDVLFESAADVYGPHLLGLVLTGANSDGSRGLKEIKENGGLTVVQDPKSAESSVMPESAITATRIDYILPLDEIGKFLASVGRKQSGKELNE